MKQAIYAGSFDPITKGHIDIIKRALTIFDKLVVAVGINSNKKYTFDLNERVDMIENVLTSFGDRVRVTSFNGLLVDFAYQENISTIIRGVRSNSDVDFERIMHDVNHSQKMGIDTFILFSDQNLSHISSSIAKEIVKNQGSNILNYVPMYVKKKLEEKILQQYIIGITGDIGSGKNYIANFIESNECYFKYKKLPVHIIDMDFIGRYILTECVKPFALEARKKLIEHFPYLEDTNCIDEIKKHQFIDLKKLKKIWGKTHYLTIFNTIMETPMMAEYRNRIFGKSGLIIVLSALLADLDKTYITNNNIVLVDAKDDIRKKRILKRGYTIAEANDRMKSQDNTITKKMKIQDSIRKFDYGNYIIVNNNEKTENQILKTDVGDFDSDEILKELLDL